MANIFTATVQQLKDNGSFTYNADKGRACNQLIPEGRQIKLGCIKLDNEFGVFQFVAWCILKGFLHYHHLQQSLYGDKVKKSTSNS